MMNFHSEEHLVTWTGVPASGTRRENFANIAPSRGDLRGYLTGVEIRGSCTYTEGVADAAKEDLWNVINSITLKGHLHEWLSSVPGWIVTVQNVMDEIISTENADDCQIVDLPEDAQGAFVHTWVVPIAPKHYQPWRLGKGEKDGMFPLAAMQSRGSLEIHVCANADIGPGGDWAVDGSGYTFKVVLKEFWTEEAIIPAPWNFRTWTDTDTDVDAPGEYGAIDMLFMVDDDAAVAVTLPTGDVRLKVDGLTIYDNVTGIHLEVGCNREGRLDSLDDIVDNQILPLRWPQQSQSMFDCPTGRQVVISNAGVAHVAAAGTPRYGCRRYLPASAEQMVEWSKLMGVRFDPAADRGLLRVAGKQAGAGVPSDPAKVAGASMGIAGTAPGKN